MAYTRKYPERINWLNYPPNMSTPVNATNLNKMDYALYEHDEMIEEMLILIDDLTARVEALEQRVN